MIVKPYEITVLWNLKFHYLCNDRPKCNMMGLCHPLKSWLTKLKINVYIPTYIVDLILGGIVEQVGDYYNQLTLGNFVLQIPTLGQLGGLAHVVLG